MKKTDKKKGAKKKRIESIVRTVGQASELMTTLTNIIKKECDYNKMNNIRRHIYGPSSDSIIHDFQ